MKKEEIAAYQKAYREANREVLAAKQRAYYEANKEKEAKRVKAWCGANKEKLAGAKKAYIQTPEGKAVHDRSTRKYSKKYPLRKKANRAVAIAVRAGRLTSQPCEVCGIIEDVNAHHDDYSKPLDVRWLCRYHHNEFHNSGDKNASSKHDKPDCSCNADCCSSAVADGGTGRQGVERSDPEDSSTSA